MLLRADASRVAVEDVRNGDKLLGPDGKPRTVTGVVRGIGELYQVTQKTGMDFVCNDEHILVMERSKSSSEDYGSISAAGNRQRKNGRYAGYVHESGYSLIKAAEYASKPERFKKQHFGFRRAIVGEDKKLPVDPYLLGVWLGDGASKAPEVTTVDAEIVDYLKSQCVLHGWNFTEVSHKNRAPRYYIGSRFQRKGSFCQQLRNAGVFENKHIPEVYFNASTEQRLSLLAGLVDTDGHISNGCLEISQSREWIIDDIIRLAWGLGFKASKRKNLISCNGSDCVVYRSQIGGDINRLPLLIERKKERALSISKNKDWRRTRVDVEPIGEGEYFGFELDGDHLFMLADGTVTHNTRGFALAAALRAWQLSTTGITGIILCGREFMNSLEDSSMAEVKAAIQSIPWLAEQYDIGEKYIRTRNRKIEFVFAGLRHNLDSIKSKSRILIAWVDEAEAVSESAWIKLLPTVREEGSEVWITWNREQEGSPTDNRFIKHPPENSIIVELNYHDNPYFPEALEQQRRDDQKRMDDGTYAWIWDGGYREESDAQIFAKRYEVAEFEPDADWTLVQGLDWGFANDPTAAVRAYVWDNKLFISHEAGKVGLELDDTPKYIMERIPDFEKWDCRADNARPESIRYVRRHGLPKVYACQKGKGSVEDGIEHIKSYDRIIIHPRCKETLNEFRLYSYQVDRLSGDIKPVPRDAYNNYIDAIRYGLEPLMKNSKFELIIA